MKIDAERLRTLRTSQGLSQAKLADKAKIHARTIRRMEREPEQCRKTREETVSMLAKALDVEPGVLTGDLPAPRFGKEPRSAPMRSPISAQIFSKSRLAYDLVSRRYGVTRSEIINLAPLFFALIAEGSLKWRREKLKEVDEAIGHIENPSALHDLSEMIQEEESSLNNADVLGEQREEHITGHLLPYNPFARYLHELDRLAVDDDQAHSSGMRIDYQICGDELAWITNRSRRARMCLEAGHARISEIPEEHMAEDAGEERAKWLEKQIPASFDEGEYELEEMLGPFGPMEKEGADQ